MKPEPDEYTLSLRARGGDREALVELVDSLKGSRIVVLDEWIGGRSSLELVLYLKAHPETQRMPLYLLCSAPSDFTVSSYFTAGVHRLVDKDRPEEIAQLTTPVERRIGVSQWFRFTESAKRVLWHAQAEARRLGEKELVGPEHLLLGLVHEADTAVAQVLARLGVARESIRAAVEQQLTPGESITEPGKMLLTAEGHEPIALAKDEAQSLPFIGTQHLLVGLLRSSDSPAKSALTALGLDLERVRREVLRMQAEATAK